MTMREMAEAVLRQMSVAEKKAVADGDVKPAAWVAERILDLNEDQAIRVAEQIQSMLRSVRVSVIMPNSGEAAGVPVVSDTIDPVLGDFNNGGILMYLQGTCGSILAEQFESVVVQTIQAVPRKWSARMVYEFRLNGVLILWWLERTV